MAEPSNVECTRNGFSATDLNELQRQLAAWRGAQRGRSRLPEQLWTAAATVAKTDGVSWVARALRLDYHRLKRRCSDSEGISPLSTRSPAFVEILLESPVPDSRRSWRIELCDRVGGRVSMEVGNDTQALLAVVEAFWRRQP